MKKMIAVLLASLVLLSALACTSEAKKEAEQSAADGFEAIVIADNDQCVAKITGMEYDRFFGNTLNVYLENKSLTRSYDFAVMDAYVNGVEWSPFFIREVGPRKSDTGKIQFVNISLEERIPEFTDIELIFTVSDSNDRQAEDIVHESVHIYPLGKEKAATYTHEPQPGDLVLEDNDQFSAVVTGYPTDTAGGLIMELFLTNKTDEKLMFWVSDVTVNGYEIDPFWAHSLKGGRMAYGMIYFLQTDFDRYGIKEVETIRMKLNVSDYEMTDSYTFEKEVTVNP